MHNISAEDYAADVARAEKFLRGQTDNVMQELQQRMMAHSDALEFEKAAEVRDQIQALSRVLHQQSMEVDADAEADIIAVKVEGGRACVNLAMVRGGRHLGDRASYPTQVADLTAPELAESSSGTQTLEAQILAAFIAQHYLQAPCRHS